MAYSTNALLIFLTIISLAFSSSSSSSSSLASNNLAASTISAAPALLPDSPSSAPPALSPDVTPLFPWLSPTESSLPIIPSSPSPPNPDDNSAAALSPALAFPPSGLLPDSSSLRLSVGVVWSPMVVSGLLASGLLCLSG